MPVVKILAPSTLLSTQVTVQLQQRATELMVRVLGKQGSLTLVVVDGTAPRAVSVGGIGVAEGKPTAVLEAYITGGTNTAEEQAKFIDEAYELLSDLLPGLQTPCYVLVHEVPATSWGYDGLTQDDRKRARSLIGTGREDHHP